MSECPPYPRHWWDIQDEDESTVTLVCTRCGRTERRPKG